jgi:hypothetical protein
MVGCSKTSESSAVIDRLLGGKVADVRAGRAQATRWHGMASACKAIAVASTLVVGVSVHALATDPPDPATDRAWGGCVLNPTAVTQLIQSIRDSSIPGTIQDSQVKVGFVVVYTLANDNDGQPLGGSTFTGPVVCKNPSEVGITALDNTGAPLKETTDIPTQTDPGPVKATSIDILAAEEAFALQYTLNNGSNAGKIEKRACYTTKGNVECFRIFPSP